MGLLRALSSFSTVKTGSLSPAARGLTHNYAKVQDVGGVNEKESLLTVSV